MTPQQRLMDYLIDFPGNWRGLFDPFSAEWSWSTLQEKIDCLKGCLKFTSFPEMVDCYRETFKFSAKQYIFDDLPYAIGLLGQFVPEAGHYFHGDPACKESPWYKVVTNHDRTIRVSGPAPIQPHFERLPRTARRGHD